MTAIKPTWNQVLKAAALLLFIGLLAYGYIGSIETTMLYEHGATDAELNEALEEPAAQVAGAYCTFIATPAARYAWGALSDHGSPYPSPISSLAFPLALLGLLLDAVLYGWVLAVAWNVVVVSLKQRRAARAI